MLRREGFPPFFILIDKVRFRFGVEAKDMNWKLSICYNEMVKGHFNKREGLIHGNLDY